MERRRRRPQAKAFSIPAELGQVRTWLEKRSDLNLGYVLNKIYQSASRNKVPSAKDIGACRGIVLDVDRAEGETREEAQARVRAKLDDFRQSGFEPTFAISTGNGAQFGWLFDQPVTLEPGEVSAKAVIEDMSAALSERHGGDATQSICHFFRLPYGRKLAVEEEARPRLGSFYAARPRRKRASLPFRTNSMHSRRR